MKLLKLPMHSNLVNPLHLELHWQTLVFVAIGIFCLTDWVSPPVALTLGILIALTLQNPIPKVSRSIAKYLLQICVVLLGFNMNLGVVLEAGSRGAVFAAISIGATFWLGERLRRWLKIPIRNSVLISAGTAICGGSAIAAMSSVINAIESEISVAMGTVFVLNAIALYIFPVLGHALHLTPIQFGTWAGVAIHDVSSVVGAASHFGLDALETATAVKLSRALWIIPVSLVAVGIWRSRQSSNQKTRCSIQIPWFIGLFLLASILQTFVPAIAPIVPHIKYFASIGLTLTLFLIGAGLSRQTLKAVGWKSMLQGVLLWVFISSGSLLVILHLVH
jgi:uncharacterized integral membrane protein (TIGR00698 family)